MKENLFVPKDFAGAILTADQARVCDGLGCIRRETLSTTGQPLCLVKLKCEDWKSGGGVIVAEIVRKYKTDIPAGCPLGFSKVETGR